MRVRRHGSGVRRWLFQYVIEPGVLMASPDSDRPAARTSLLPVLGLFFGIAVSIGGTLGVGILRQPGPVASYPRARGIMVASSETFEAPHAE